MGDRRSRSAPRRIATLLLLAALSLACSGDGGPHRRILLIGIDGASPKLMRRLMAEGRLPHLTTLAEQGVWGRLRSQFPLYSPRIWNTMVTGKGPRKHGVIGFTHVDARGHQHLYDSRDRKVPALWNIFSEAGFRVAVVNWWTTYPPEEIDGVMVSDHFFPEQSAMLEKFFEDQAKPSGTLLYPAEWEETALAQLTASEPVSDVPDPFTSDTTLPHWLDREVLRQHYRTDTRITRTALAADRDFAPDVLMVFLPGIDRVSHALWGNLEPAEKYPPELRPTPAERAGGTEALKRYYAYTDSLIGRLIEGRPPEDLIMIVSDHGFEAGVTHEILTGEHEGWSALYGVVFARGAGIQAGGHVHSMQIYDVTPTLLAWMGLPPAEDMPGHIAAFLPGGEPQRIASYDDTPVRRVTTTSTGRESEIIEQLKALGYLDTRTGAKERRREGAHGRADER